MAANVYTESQTAELVQLKKAKEPTAKSEEAVPAKCGITKFGTSCAFLKCGACSKTMMHVLDREYDEPMKVEEDATMPLAGGLMQGYQCGMLWGGTLAAGAQAYRVHGAGPQSQAKAINAAQKLVDSFKAQNGHMNCLEITDTDPQNMKQVFIKFFVKAGIVSCISRAAKFAPKAHEDINTALNEQPCQGTCNPASCAAKFTEKMGASEKYTTMVSGLAGGIGLSGGACGALGAAIWILAIEGTKQGLKFKEIETKINELTESFLKSAKYEYECSEIVGRKFEDVEDHSKYVQDGGCTEIIDTLAAKVQELLSTTQDESKKNHQNVTPAKARV